MIQLDISCRLTFRRCRNNSDFILLTWSMLATQPRVPWFESLPKSSGGSILVLLWSLGAFVIVLSYTNTILASLVATDVNAPLDSMDKLAAQIEENEGEVWFVEVCFFPLRNLGSCVCCLGFVGREQYAGFFQSFVP